MRSHAFLVALTFGACSLPAFGADAPLRHLTFTYEVGITQVFEQPTSGMSNSGAGGMSGAAVQRSNTSTADRGTIVADVVAATSDGGLLIDASEAGREGRKPQTKVGVRSDGALLIDPKAELSDEERYLLSLLPRNLMAGNPAEVGKSWRFEFPSSKNAGDITTYKVTGVDGTVAHLAVERTAFNHTVRPFDLHVTGTVDYDAKLLVPTNAKLHGILRSQGSDGFTTVTTDVVLTLDEDSFRKAAMRN